MNEIPKIDTIHEHEESYPQTQCAGQVAVKKYRLKINGKLKVDFSVH